MLRKNQINEKTSPYATGADFCRIFSEEMTSLYLLALLLAANPETAERCFVASLEDCTSTNRVFKDWAWSWSRRAIIENAIRLVAPTPGRAESAIRPHGHKTPKSTASNRVTHMPAAVLELPAFDRFVFGMSVLEKLSILDCSLLLGRPRRQVIEARTRAFRCLAMMMLRPPDSSRQTLLEPVADLASSEVG